MFSSMCVNPVYVILCRERYLHSSCIITRWHHRLENKQHSLDGATEYQQLNWTVDMRRHLPQLMDRRWTVARAAAQDR